MLSNRDGVEVFPRLGTVFDFVPTQHVGTALRLT
jgi:hypothetical protein